MRNLCTEQEIMADWTQKLASPLVSICCTTFNHDKYIEDAIEGFLNQKTNFPFEILIRDDASIDRTPDILEEYETKYPKIIKVIYESENQYSKGIKPLLSVIQVAKGDYIAVCEGDDYWVAENKLQKQLDVFITNPKTTICFHPALEYDLNEISRKKICNHYKENQIVMFKDVATGRGGFMPTASLMFKNIRRKELIEIISLAPLGDFFLQCYIASLGETYYINETMCVYRRNVPGSWTESQNDADNKLRYYFGMVTSIDRFLKYILDKKDKQSMVSALIFYANGYISLSRTVPDKITSLLKLMKNVNNIKLLEFTLKLFQFRYL